MSGQKQRALITGACSGIGLALARELATRGWDLCVASERGDRLAAAASELRALGCTVDEVVMDLSQPSAARALFDASTKDGAAVDALVCNAGFFFFGEVADADPERAERMLTLHVVVPSLLCTLFAREFRRRKRGHVLLVSSISAFRDFPGIAYYASSKKYLRAFATSLRCELEPYGVTVTCLLPGATATGLYDPNVVPVELASKLGVMMSAERVAREGVDAMLRGEGERIPGLFNRAVVRAVERVPQAAIDAVRRWGPWLKAKDP
ncbi:MAG: SDR family NAD(P)-dependent oxidoreductase [Myxococcales bacterium]|nr:SDR family NAD(P)-dependent oxidoreductase [Myxococcales bacterium]